MSNRLWNILTFTNVAPGATASLPHLLNNMGQNLLPDFGWLDNAGFTPSATTTHVSLINDTGVVASATVLVCAIHTSIRVLGGTAIPDMSPKPFWVIGGAGFGTLSGTFATFDPRIDGLAASPGSVWFAADTPLTMTKIGPADTDWNLDERSSLALCTTAEQINALYQGFARQPALDFAPTHLLTPDEANDRFFDHIAGDHLTRQGLGTGATIQKGPLFDNLSEAGYQAQQLHGNASYYAATSVGAYDVSTEAYATAWLGSYTQTPEGGVSFSKINMPAGIATGTGWAVSINAFGGFGFLINGPILDLNTDTPFGTPNIVDGKVRVFHHGRSIIGAGYGYVRTANIASVSQAGLAGNISAADCLFGLVQDAGGVRTAAGNQQVQKIAFWQGAAAENVAAYCTAIEEGLQAQLGSVEQQLVQAPAWQDFVPSTPVRALDVAFQPNPLRPTWCSYSCKILTDGLGNGAVRLLSDGSNPPTTVRAEIRREILAGAFTDHITGQLTYICPPSEFILLQTVDVGGTGTTFSLDFVTETQLP